MPVFVDANQVGFFLGVRRCEDEQAQSQSAGVIPLGVDAAAIHAVRLIAQGDEEA